MNMSSNRDWIEMDLMWIVMAVMFIFDGVMLYIHAKMHKRVKFLENQLNAIATNNPQ